MEAEETDGLTGVHMSKRHGPIAYFIAYSFPVRKFYWFCFAVLFLSWIPVLLASWPGIFSYDCGWQLGGGGRSRMDCPSPDTPYGHAVADETARKGAHRLQSGPERLSIPCFRWLSWSALYADVCLYLRQKKAPKWLWVGALVFLGFHPVNSLMALCATKDSIFTAVFAVFVVQLLRMAEYPEIFFAFRAQTDSFLCQCIFPVCLPQ